MKALIFLLCSLPTITSAQRACDTMFQVTNDKFTSKKYMLLKPAIVIVDTPKKSFLILVVGKWPDGRVHLDAIVEAPDFHCVDEGATNYFLFADSSRFDARNLLAFNCDGKSSIYIGGRFMSKRAKELRDKLRSVPLRSFRAQSRKTYYDVDLTENDSERLKSAINCLLEDQE